MKKLTLIIGLLYGFNLFAQIKTTKNAFVSFYSEMEEVTAENYSGVSDLDISTGKLIFSFAIQSFMFENATMQKHFNESDVMNSKEYPRARFVGNITNNTSINYSANGEYKVKVKGTLTIKDKSNAIETNAIVKIENGKIYANATFTLDRFQYNVMGKEGSISQLLELTVKAEYE